MQQKGKREKQREKIKQYLENGWTWKKILEKTGASKTTISRVKKKMNKKQDLKHQRRGPPKNKVLTEEFLRDLEKSYKKSPNMSLKSMAEAKNVSKATILNGRKILEAKGIVYPLKLSNKNSKTTKKAKTICTETKGI